ncbi:MAG: PPC domain-containing protein [Phormidesmis sp.]
MRALQKLSAVCVATGFLVVFGWGPSWHSGQWLPEWNAEQSAKADTLLETEGSLVSGDAVLDDGSLYDQYKFSGAGGQYVTIFLESNDFDPYLILLDPNGQRIGENDDISRTNRNSRLIVTLPATGTYTAVANSYESGKNGGYAIKVDIASDWTSLSQTLARTAVPNSNTVCTRAIADMTNTLETDREASAVVSSLQLDRLYIGGPSVRPNGVNVSINGPAALSVMFSPQLLTQMSAQLVGACSSVGAIIFSTEAGDYERTFGFLPMPGNATDQVARGDEAAEMVTEFSCVSRQEGAPSTPLTWGESFCS